MRTAPPGSHRPRPVAMRAARAPWSGPVAVGRDVPIAPPRHRRGARLGTVHTLRVLHAAACQRGLPARAAIPHGHGARALPVSARHPGRRDGRPPGLPARALPPLHTRNSHAEFARGVCPRIIPANPLLARAPLPRHRTSAKTRHYGSSTHLRK